jgi:hypothetical protein
VHLRNPGALHLLFFSFSVLFTSPLLWRGVLDTLAAALIPAFFLWVFSLLPCWILPTFGIRIFAFVGVLHQRQLVFAFSIFLDTCPASMALFLFVLFS